jgi:hypothetical protein
MREYFLRLIDALESLERSIFRVNDLKREFEFEVNKLVNRQALFVALVLPIVLLVAYTINGSGMFSDNILHEQADTVFIRMFGAGFIIWTFGVLLDFFFKFLFYRDYLPEGKAAKQKKILPKYEEKRKIIVADGKMALTEEMAHSEIPEEYLNVPTIGMLMNYMNEGKAKNLAQAIELIKEERGVFNRDREQSIIRKFQAVESEDFWDGED